VCQPLAISPPKWPRAAAADRVHGLWIVAPGEFEDLGLADHDRTASNTARWIISK